MTPVKDTVIVAENWDLFRHWCHDRRLDPRAVRAGNVEPYICAITSEWAMKCRGFQRGLKWIEVGRLPWEAREMIKCRAPQWVEGPPID